MIETQSSKGSSRTSRFRHYLLLAGAVLCNVGLFTISWDLLGNISVGSFNVKVSVVLFGLSLFLTLGATSFRPLRRIPMWLGAVVSAMLLTMVVSSILAENTTTGILSTLTVVVGAFTPALAVLGATQLPGKFQEMLKWFVWGAVAACLFGLYQLSAFYLDFPQLIEYEGVSGGLGRISSFSYEPAYLGYFLVLALVAALTRLRADNSAWSRVHIVLFLVTLILLNSRAVFLTLPLLILLVRPISSGLISPKKAWIAVSAVAAAGLLVCVLVPSIPKTLMAQFLSIFNPNEVSSNAPRLQLFDAAWGIAREHPWAGVGPSNFGLHIADLDYAQYEGVSLNKMVVNNVWLQALMDGGFILAILQLLLVVLVVVKIYFSGGVSERILISGWLSVVLVGGMVVSNFYDAKLWVVLALAIVALQQRTGEAVRQDLPGTPGSYAFRPPPQPASPKAEGAAPREG